MTESEFQEKVRGLKEKFPNSFSQPGLKPNEMCIGLHIAEVAGVQATIYRAHGLPSARTGPGCMSKVGGVEKEVSCFPIFVDVREFVESEEAEAAQVKG